MVISIGSDQYTIDTYLWCAVGANIVGTGVHEGLAIGRVMVAAPNEDVTVVVDVQQLVGLLDHHPNILACW